MFKKALFSLLVLSFLVVPLALKAQSADDIARQIAELQRQIAELKVKLAQLQGQSGQWCYTFNRNLGVDASGRDVRELHTALGKEGFPVLIDKDINGANRYSENTAAAVSQFQEKYRQEILTANGLSAPTGYFGPATRKKMNSLYGCGNIVPPSPQQVYITPTSLPSVVVGQIYTQFFDAYGFSLSSAALDWSIVGGSLPAGLVLEKGSLITCPVPPIPTPPGWRCPGPDMVIITGRIDNSQTVGTYTFIVQATDGIKTARRTYTLVVRGTGDIGNRPPSISGVAGPTTRNVGQTGTWTVKAAGASTDTTLTAQVIWGDDGAVTEMGTLGPSILVPTVVRWFNFTHTYTRAGTYYPAFTVTDNAGQSARTSLSVAVGGDTANTPHINSIIPASGPVGTTVEIRGSNLSGFEGDLIAVFERSDGKVTRLRSIVPYSTGVIYSPLNTTLIKVKVEPPCQRGQTVYGDYSGIPSVCDYFEFTPGVYKVYVYTWDKKSNEVQYTIGSLPPTL